MTSKDRSMDRQLDTLLAELAAELPRPDDALLARIGADAERHMPNPAGLRNTGTKLQRPLALRRSRARTDRQDPRGSGGRAVTRWRNLSSAAALAGCLLAGVWFGFNAPNTAFSLSALGETGSYLLPLIGADDALSGVASDREI